MQLSYHADYSCRVLMYLAVKGAGRGEGKASVEEIARSFRISVNHLVKVVHQLGKLGFVETSRGRGGGVRLGRDPSEISLGAVVRAMEPGFELVECFNAEANTCPMTGVCGLQTALTEAREAFLTTLDRYSIADAIADRSQLARILQADLRGAAGA